MVCLQLQQALRALAWTARISGSLVSALVSRMVSENRDMLKQLPQTRKSPGAGGSASVMPATLFEGWLQYGQAAWKLKFCLPIALIFLFFCFGSIRGFAFLLSGWPSFDFTIRLVQVRMHFSFSAPIF